MFVIMMTLATPRDAHDTAVALLEGTEVIAQDMSEGLELLLGHLRRLLEYDPRHVLGARWRCERTRVGVVRGGVGQTVGKVDFVRRIYVVTFLLWEAVGEQRGQETICSADRVAQPDHSDLGRVDGVVLKHPMECHRAVLSPNGVLGQGMEVKLRQVIDDALEPQGAPRLYSSSITCPLFSKGWCIN